MSQMRKPNGVTDNELRYITACYNKYLEQQHALHESILRVAGYGSYYQIENLILAKRNADRKVRHFDECLMFYNHLIIRQL